MTRKRPTKSDTTEPELTTQREQIRACLFQAELRFVFLSPVREWNPAWAGFLAQHRAWWERHGATGPVYALPESVVRHLTEARPASGARHRARRSLLTDDEAAAECAFMQLCD